jgi:hypothetical protein
LKKEIVVPPEAPEADVFHELVHYLMDCEGLLFTHFHLKPDLQFEETLFFFYEKLIDETMAEYATFKVFDYDQETVIMYPKNGIAEDYRELQRIFLSGDDQEIEKRLPKLEQMIGRSIYQCYFERQLSYLTEAARLIAVDNTLKLQEKSIRTLDLIARIREAKTRLSNPTEIYIESIAEAMR